MADKKIIAVSARPAPRAAAWSAPSWPTPTAASGARDHARPESESAKALAQLGAEVVPADLDDEASLERGVRTALTAPSA